MTTRFIVFVGTTTGALVLGFTAIALGLGLGYLLDLAWRQAR